MSPHKGVLFALFALCAIAFKLLTPWIPIDMVLAFCFWVGLHQQKKKGLWALALFGVILFSDLLFHAINHWPLLYPDMPFNYLAMGSVFVFGFLFNNHRSRIRWQFLGLNFGILSFFLVSNFGVYVMGGIYPHTAEGLLACYVAALPFIKVQWLSNNLAWGVMHVVGTIVHSVPLPSLKQAP